LIAVERLSSHDTASGYVEKWMAVNLRAANGKMSSVQSHFSVMHPEIDARLRLGKKKGGLSRATIESIASDCSCLATAALLKEFSGHPHTPQLGQATAIRVTGRLSSEQR
jgi:hypothetical protein